MNYPMTDIEARESLIGEIYLLKKIYGYSAYELAVKHGFKGSEEEWLYSHNAYSIAVRNGFRGSEEDWLLSLTAYGLAVRNGFEGTLEEWILSLKGEKGDPGNVELFGAFDALDHNINNVAEPVDEKDAVNKSYADTSIAATRLYADKVGENVKKYVDDKNVASKEFVSENYVKKTDQLDALGMTVKNVAEPSTDTDAVNKKYVHDTFQKGAIEDISEDFISQVSEGFTVSSIKVYKQCNVICGEVAFTGELTEDGVVMFIKSKYAPLADVSTPLLTNLTDASAFYFDEGRNVLISKTIGAVMAGAYHDNQGFTKEFKFNFTYLC